MTQLESRSQKDDSMNYIETSELSVSQSTNLSSRNGLIRRLGKSRDSRVKFVESHLNKKLALQIRSLRGDLSQEQMEEKVGIKQQALSRLENPYYGKATLTTLKRIAAGCDVALLVEFVPFSQLINRISGTPYEELGFSPETMSVPSFDQEFSADLGSAESQFVKQTKLERAQPTGRISGLGSFLGCQTETQSSSALSAIGR